MPRQYQAFPQNLGISNNPLSTLAFDPTTIIEMGIKALELPNLLELIEALIRQLLKYAEQIPGMIEFLINTVLEWIDQITGLNLLGVVLPIEDFINAFLSVFGIGNLTDLGSNGTALGFIAGQLLLLPLDFLNSILSDFGMELLGANGTTGSGLGASLADLLKIPFDFINAVLSIFGMGSTGHGSGLTIGSSLGHDIGGALALPTEFINALLSFFEFSPLGSGGGVTATNLARALATLLMMPLDFINSLLGIFHLGALGGISTASELATLLGDIMSMPQNIINTITGISGGNLLDLGQWFSDLVGSLGNILNLGSGNPIINGLHSIPILGPILTYAQTTLDHVFAGLTGMFIPGSSPADVGNALANLTQTVGSSLAIAQDSSLSIGMQAMNTPAYHAVDPTLNATFHLTTMTGSSPDTISVSAANTAIGFINIPTTATKQSVAFYGEAVGSVTGVYLNVYLLDTSAATMTPVWSSTNIQAFLSRSDMEWVYTVVSPSLPVAQSAWYAMEMQVVGSGSVTLVGMPNHWIKPNTAVCPQQLAASRATVGGVTAPPASIHPPTYSDHVPWFGLSSENAQSFYAPEIHFLNSAGTSTIPIPSWVDVIDVIAVGGGGSYYGSGGTSVITVGSNTFAAYGGAGGVRGDGSGGSPGDLVYNGLDFKGGGGVGAAQPGQSPGGGGGGPVVPVYGPFHILIWYYVTEPGGNGGSWVAQSVKPAGASTVSVTVGGGYWGGGADGAAWVILRQQSQHIPARFTGSGQLSTLITSLRPTGRTTGVGSMTASVFSKISKTSSLSGTGRLTASRYTQSVGRVSGHGVLSGKVKLPAAAQLSGHGSLVALTNRYVLRTATFNGRGLLAPTVQIGITTTVTPLIGQGALSAPLQIIYAPALSSTGSLTAFAESEYFRVALTAGTGTLSSAARMYKISRSALTSGNGVLAATIIAQSPRSAALSGHGVLAVTIQVKTPAVVSGHGVLTGKSTPNLPARATGTGVLSGPLKVKISGRFSGAGTLSSSAWGTTRFSGVGSLTAPARILKVSKSAALPGRGLFLPNAQPRYTAYESKGAGYSGQSTTPSFAHTIGENSTALVVAVTGYSPAQANVNFWIRTVKVGPTLGTAVSLTSLGSQNCNNAAAGWVELFGLINPPTGAQNIYISETYLANVPYLTAESVAFTGVAKFGTAVVNSGNSGTQTTTAVASATNNTVLALMGVFQGTYSTWNAAGIWGSAAGATNYVTGLMQSMTGAATCTLTSATGSAVWSTVAVNLFLGRTPAISGRGTLSARTTNTTATPLTGHGVLSATVSRIDTFSRANASTLGANWFAFDTIGGVPGVDFAIYNNKAIATTNTTDYAADLYGSPLSTDNQYVSVTLAATPASGVHIHLLLRSEATPSTGQRAYLHILQAGGFWQASLNGGTLSYSSGTLTPALAAGDTIFFQAVGNVYSFGKNGVTIGSYTDTGSAGYPYSGSSYRTVGIACTDPNGGPTAAFGLTDFTARDI